MGLSLQTVAAVTDLCADNDSGNNNNNNNNVVNQRHLRVETYKIT